MPRRGWLVDNQVPRSVTRLLRTSGHDTVEVRSVLGGDAPDAAITAYARLTDVIDAIDAGATQLVLTRDGALEIEP